MSDADSLPSARYPNGSDARGPSALPFSLGFEDGRGLLRLSEVELPFLRIARLELEIPGLTFPFDLTGGTKRLRDRWLEATRLDLEVPAEQLRAWLARHVHPERQGLAALEAAFDRGALEVVGTVGQEDAGTRFVLRYLVDVTGERDLALRPALFVLLGRPTVSKMQVAGALAKLAEPWAERDGLSIVFRLPTRRALKALMPPRGYRLADDRRLRHRAAEVRPSGLTLSFAAYGAPASNRNQEAMAVAEVEDLLRPGDDALLENGPDAARSLYVEALGREPGHPVALERLTWLDAARHEGREAALATCSRRLAGRDDAGLRAIVASLALENHDVPTAVGQYEALLGRLGSLGRARLLHFIGRLERDRSPESAAARYESALELAPTLVEALESLLESHAAAGKRELLEATGARLVAALASPAERAAALVELGELWLARFSDVAQAGKAFEQALLHEPDEPRALLGLAEARMVDGDAAGALRCIDSAARIASDRGLRVLETRAHVRAGEVWQLLDDLDSSAARFRRALSLDPERLEAVIGAAEVDAALGRLAEAEAALRKAARIAEERGDDESWRRATVGLARLLLEEMGGPEAAAPLVRSLAAKHPADEEVLELVALAKGERDAPPPKEDDGAGAAGDEPDGEPLDAVEAHFGATTPAGAVVRGLEDVEALLRAFELDPSDRKLATRLAASLEARRDWPRLVAVLANLKESADSPEEKGRILLRLGEATLEGFDDGESAAEAFVDAAPLLPPEEGAKVARRAAELFAGEGRHEDELHAADLAGRLAAERDEDR